MPLTILRQSITKICADAIVNAANTDLLMGGGVCGDIFRVAGAENLQKACKELAPIQMGETAVTKAFDLPAKIIIHAAGPVYRNGRCGEAKLLRACYINSLKCALEHECTSIAFPLISSGTYRYPKDKALKVATAAIEEFLTHNDISVFLAVFDNEAFAASKKLMGKVESYLQEYCSDASLCKERFQKLLPLEERLLADLQCCNAVPLNSILERLDESFSESLLRLIDQKGLKDAEVYKRANLDRKLFSKIRTGKNYLPSKRTALALAIALRLSLAETENLLRCAGYALSHSQKFDVIIEYFIVNRRWNILEINEILFQYDLPLLGG